MGILYLLSLLILFVTFLSLKKSEQKLNIVTWITIGIVTLLCYNILITYVLNLCYILIKLPILAGINLVISCIFFFLMIQKKEVQKYTIQKRDILVSVILFIMVGILSVKNFGFPFHIKYVTTDAAAHYTYAQKFYEESRLANYSEDKHINTKAFMPGAYVNVGLLFKALDDFIDPLYFYKIFIAFDIFLLFLAAMMMYASLIRFAKNKRLYFCACLLTVIYTLGYPLNSTIFGFQYFTLGIILVHAVILIMEYSKGEICNYHKIGILSLLTFGLFFSYLLFVPIVYGALFLSFIIEKRRNREKIFCLPNVFAFFIMFAIPSICGFTFLILPGLLEQNSVVNAVANEGYIYKNFYSNFIVFLPIFAIGLIKKEKNPFHALFVLFLTAYTILFVIFTFGGQVSSYYMSKNYFIVWIVVLYIFFKGIVFIDEKNKYIGIGFFSIYLIGILIASNFTVAIPKTVYNQEENPTKLFDIFAANFTVIQKWSIDYTQEELEILEYVREHIDFDKKVGIVGHYRQLWWFYGIFRYSVVDDFYDVPIDYQKWADGEVYDIVIYFNKSDAFQNHKELILTGKTHIMQNEAGGILIK